MAKLKESKKKSGGNKNTKKVSVALSRKKKKKESSESDDRSEEKSGDKESSKEKSSESEKKTKGKGKPKGKVVKKEEFVPIPDQFTTYEEVQAALRKAGLESSNLIIGIDFTKSNKWTGQTSFGGKCLHDITPNSLNPYQEVIQIVGETLSVFDDDGLIPVFGFGDIVTKDRSVFPFLRDRPCNGFQEVLQLYNQITPTIQLAGPTSFAPLIRETINIVKEAKGYHILIIVADGQVTSLNDTIDAIVEASKHPISIIMVGVGDGPWDQMEEFDDGLPERDFDNFHFVEFHSILKKYDGSPYAFAVCALQEIPEQFSIITRLGLL